MNRTGGLAHAAIAAALGAAFLAVGFYLQVLEFLWYFLAALTLMIPLCRGYIRFAALAYIVSALLALALCAFQFLFIMPYVVFMGPHLIVNAVMEKRRLNAWLRHLVKVVWFDASVYLLMLLTSLFAFVDIRAGWATALAAMGVATLAYFAYDYCVGLVEKDLYRRFGKPQGQTAAPKSGR